MEVTPEQLGNRDWNREKVVAVDGDTRTFAGRFVAPLLCPAAAADVPQGESLQRSGLAGVVWTNQDNGWAQFNLNVLEPLEVSDV